MPTLLRSVMLGIPLAIWVVLLSTPNVGATASPYYAPDYNARFVPHRVPSSIHHTLVKRSGSSRANRSMSGGKHLYKPKTTGLRPALKRVASSIAQSLYYRDLPGQLETLLDGFSDGRDDAQANAKALRALAEQSGVASGDGDDFQQNAASQATAFHSTMQALEGLFTKLAANDGLANYDKNSELETIIKDTVNASKNSLTSLNLIIYNIPTLGPVLGPIVYDIKCLIDDILDALENLTDALLNALGPGFSGLLGQANSINCASNLKVLGLCV